MKENSTSCFLFKYILWKCPKVQKCMDCIWWPFMLCEQEDPLCFSVITSVASRLQLKGDY